MAYELASLFQGAEPAFAFLLFLPFVVALAGVGARLVECCRKGD